jgi:hypothetical protein
MFLFHNVNACSGIHVAPYTIDTGIVYHEVKRQECEATAHLKLVARVRMMEPYLHSHIRPHSSVLNSFNLPFTAR